MQQPNISFVGAGRVAGALCREMYRAGFRIDLIVSESESNGRSLANSTNALWSSDLVFPDSTGLIIVAVPDHKLKSILERIKCQPDALVAHTAGSIGTDIFPEQIRRKGILYPLQTFSRDRKIDFNGLPMFLESSDKQSSEILEKVADALGSKAYFVDTEHRKLLHLSAVFVCNFTNHMLTAGKTVALKAGFPFEILEPLLRETVSKAIDIGPENSQTGPAVRNDRNTIEKHIELLSFSPELKRIYSEMTRSIIDYHNKS